MKRVTKELYEAQDIVLLEGALADASLETGLLLSVNDRTTGDLPFVGEQMDGVPLKTVHVNITW